MCTLCKVAQVLARGGRPASEEIMHDHANYNSHTVITFSTVELVCVCVH